MTFKMITLPWPVATALRCTGTTYRGELIGAGTDEVATRGVIVIELAAVEAAEYIWLN